MNPSLSTFGISDLAREFGITPRTIRFWEDQGLLSPQREGRNRRQAAEQELVRLEQELKDKLAAAGK